MSIQNYDLTGLEEAYDKLQADKTSKKLAPLEIILQLNKIPHIDEVLIRAAFSVYQHQDQLKSSQKYPTFEAFFKYVVDNINIIEQKYLSECYDQELLETAEKENPSEQLFLVNKNNVSKFIKDEEAHYQAVLEKYLQVGSQGERGIKTSKMHVLMMELFRNKHTKIIRNKVVYLQEPQAEIALDIGNNLHLYGIRTKDLTAQKATTQFYINQQEILDFLTFWLKQQATHQLFVLYARTTTRLERQAKILLNQSTVKSQLHPSKMTSHQIAELQQQQLQKSALFEDRIPVTAIETPQRGMKVQQSSTKLSSIGNINPQLSSFQEVLALKEKRQVSKQQILSKQLQNLFNYGCKRRYKLNKNSTFQQLQYELTYMDLQKFINFCLFFEVTSIISKEIVTEYFKMNAINRQRIDFERFQRVIEQLIRTDPRVIDNLLNRKQFEVKKKQKQIENNQKLDGGVSKYHFKLRPVNGKDISTMKKELQYKKLEKQIVRETKDHEALVKREKLQQSKVNARSISNLQNSRLTNNQKQPAQEFKLNLEHLVGQQKEKDRLWDAYEAKIWRKQQKVSNSILQSVLSRRIQKGNSIITKINSQRSLLFE